MPETEKPTLLMVDDDQPNLTIFRAMYMRQYNVITALSGEEGLEKLKENSDIKICFSDLRMPVMDGLEFVQKAREDYPEVAYVIFSGSDLNDDMEQNIENGIIDGYVRKPFKSEILNETINRFLQ